MHWLPLVAMVIASALPFPHSPVSRIVAASTEPGPRIDSRGEDHNVSASHLAAPAQPPVDYNLLLRKASQMDYNMAAARGEDAREQSRSAMHNKDYVKTSVHEGLSTFKGKSQESFQVNTNSDSGNMNEISLDVHVPTGEGKLRTSNNNSQKDSVSTDNSVAEDYQTHSHSRRKDMNYADFAVGDKLRSSLYSGTIEKNDIGPLQVSGGGAHSAASHAASLPDGKGPQSPVPLEQSSGSAEQGSNVNRGEGSHGSPEIGLGQEQSQERQGMEAGLGLGFGVDGIPKGDEMLFLDAHPRVLFSPSPLPPKHPPLLLMLETGVLQEDGEDEEEDEADRYIEGHGDRAIDRSGLPMGTDDLGGGSEPVQHIKRNKRSHMTEARRGERSVCETESVWVTDKKTAIDSHGRTVTILPVIQTQTGPLKQYFYETRCRRAEPQRDSAAGRSRGSRDASGAAGLTGQGVAGESCLGVDKKQWVSECKAKQSYVRALTKDANNRTGWRWIRLDSSCVCVLLSRVNRQWAGRA